jgi:hypothetical protein
MKTFIGCDPGASGGIGVIYPDRSEVYKMPETEEDMLSLFGSIARATTGNCICLVETVHAMPKQGVSSTFKFGMGYGALRMAVRASGIPFEGITPQKWQKGLGCLTGGEKNVSKERAQNLFPHLKIIHATADAILIAEYLRRRETGTL